MTDVKLALAVMGVMVAYCLLALASPHMRCLRCRGKRVIRRASGRSAQCPGCKGAGKQQRPGAPAVHRFFWSMAGDRALGRRREELARQLAAKKEETQ